jgi:tetratricopeptide (TPR) repeat protein
MDAYREKALLLCDLKRYPEAVNTLIRAVTLQNSYEEGYYYLGQCYEKMGEIRKAMESYQTALMYDSRDRDAADALNRLTKE